MTFIDLSVPLNEDTPVYPGDPITKIAPAGILEKTGFKDHYVSLGTHAGTHIDAPAHVIKDGATLDQFDVDTFVGRGVCIKTDKEITLEKAQRVDIQKGDIVLLNTGMSDAFYKKEYFDGYPAIPEDVANYLVEKEIKMIGLDMCSADKEGSTIHKIFLKSKVLVVENLTNLQLLEGKKFKVYAFPLKLQLDGSPARVVAEIL
jgi:kynurenine formamidase